MLYMCAEQTVMLVQIGCYTAQNITKKMILSTSKHKKHGTGGLIMTRLIDADTLIERLKFKRRLNGNIPDKCAGYDSAIAQANKLPSVDPVHAAGVCYCNECKFVCIGENEAESWCYCNACAHKRSVASMSGGASSHRVEHLHGPLYPV